MLNRFGRHLQCVDHLLNVLRVVPGRYEVIAIGKAIGDGRFLPAELHCEVVFRDQEKAGLSSGATGSTTSCRITASTCSTSRNTASTRSSRIVTSPSFTSVTTVGRRLRIGVGDLLATHRAVIQQQGEANTQLVHRERTQVAVGVRQHDHAVGQSLNQCFPYMLDAASTLVLVEIVIAAQLDDPARPDRSAGNKIAAFCSLLTIVDRVWILVLETRLFYCLICLPLLQWIVGAVKSLLQARSEPLLQLFEVLSFDRLDIDVRSFIERELLRITPGTRLEIRIAWQAGVDRAEQLQPQQASFVVAYQLVTDSCQVLEFSKLALVVRQQVRALGPGRFGFRHRLLPFRPMVQMDFLPGSISEEVIERAGQHQSRHACHHPWFLGFHQAISNHLARQQVGIQLGFAEGLYAEAIGRPEGEEIVTESWVVSHA